MPRNDDTLMMRKPHAPLGIIALDSFKEQAKDVDRFLVEWRARRNHYRLDEITRMTYESDTYFVDAVTPRFGSGQAKGVITQSIRGLDFAVMLGVSGALFLFGMFGRRLNRVQGALLLASYIAYTAYLVAYHT